MQSDEEIIQQLENPEIDDVVIGTFGSRLIDYDTIMYKKSTNKYYFIRLNNATTRTTINYTERVINDDTVYINTDYIIIIQVCMYDFRETHARNGLYRFLKKFIKNGYNYKIIQDWLNELHNTAELIFK